MGNIAPTGIFYDKSTNISFEIKMNFTKFPVEPNGSFPSEFLKKSIRPTLR